MHRYNFPNRVVKRRQAALERLKKQSAKDAEHANKIKEQISNLENKLKSTTVVSAVE